MRELRAVSVLVLLCLIPYVVVADQVVLRDGERIDGTIAGRDGFAESPSDYDVVSILVVFPDGTNRLERYEASQIDYVVLEGPGAAQIVDMALPRSGRSLTAGPEQGPTDESSWTGRHTGLAFIAGGGLVLAIGAFFKFGDEKVTITESTVDYDEKSYNALNYVMIGCGAVLIAVGTGLAVSSPLDSRAFLTLGRDVDGTSWIGIGYRF